jgi:hypothetical protein
MTRQTRGLPEGQEATSVEVERGRPVEVAPGLTAFDRITFTASLVGSYDLDGTLVLDDPPSRYLLDSITIRRQVTLPYFKHLPAEVRTQRESHMTATARPVTAEGVRSVAIEREVSEVLRHYGVENTGARLERADAATLRDAGIGDEDALAYVAAVYLAASLRGDAPAAWVAHHLECSSATASRWIAAAKDAGFLRVADTRRR